MTVITWIDHEEAVVGASHPTLLDVVNRPLRNVLTISGIVDTDTDFDGFLIRRTGAGSPEGAVTSTASQSYIDTVTGDLYIKQSAAGSTGWVRAGNKYGNGSPE